MMLHSAEMRWFFVGPAPEAVADWLDARKGLSSRTNNISKIKNLTSRRIDALYQLNVPKSSRQTEKDHARSPQSFQDWPVTLRLCRSRSRHCCQWTRMLREAPGRPSFAFHREEHNSI
jgi:hypothetical protein